MKKYTVHIKEIIERDVVVLAADEISAEDKTADMCNKGKIEMCEGMFDFERKITCLGEAERKSKIDFHCDDEWKAYLEYLTDWAESKSNLQFYGQSPVCFDEWCDMEYLEEDEDA